GSGQRELRRPQLLPRGLREGEGPLRPRAPEGFGDRRRRQGRLRPHRRGQDAPQGADPRAGEGRLPGPVHAGDAVYAARRDANAGHRGDPRRPQEDPGMKTRGIAVIGSGAIADQHLGAIRDIPHAKLVGVYSRGADKAKKVGEREKCRWTTDYKDLLKDPAVDIVDIVTSSGSHASITREALQAGKHVLVE